MLRSYKELVVWQKSFTLAVNVSRLSREFPTDERYGLAAQIRRSAVSVPSNIAEGYSRDTTRDYLRFLWLANGSLAELETQLMIATELGYITNQRSEELMEAVAEISRMLRALISSLQAKLVTQSADHRESRPAPNRSNPKILKS